MIHLLSTKKLDPHQKELLLNSGFGVVDLDFISTNSIDFALSEIPKNLIFTSKNAVKAVLEHSRVEELKTKAVFAVGKTTTNFLSSHGFKVTATANYGAELAEKILAERPKEQFLFFCGKKRHPDLPEKLKKSNVFLEEIAVYDTLFTPKKLGRIFNGVLFFSPSGVESYCSKNELYASVAFCIGTTTASEAKKHTENVIIATRPSIENVIVQVVKYFNKSRNLS